MGITNNKLLQVQSKDGDDCTVKSLGGNFVNGGTTRDEHAGRTSQLGNGNKPRNSSIQFSSGSSVRSANTSITKIGGNMDPIIEISNQRAWVRKSLTENGVTRNQSEESSDDSKPCARNLDDVSGNSEYDDIDDYMGEFSKSDETDKQVYNSEEADSGTEDDIKEHKSESIELGNKCSTEEAITTDDMESKSDNLNRGEEIQGLRLSKALYDGQLNVRQEGDNSRCDITGCVVFDCNKLAIADNWNGKVKIFEIKERSLIACIQLETKPWDIAEFHFNYLVTTCNNVLSILCIAQEPSSIILDRQISVQGRPRGITSTNDTFIVSFIHPEPCVKIIQENGNVIKVIKSDANGLHIFKCPEYVTVDPKNGVIYVTDFHLNKVFCLTADGDILSFYQDESLNKPAGVVIDRNYDVLIAGWGSENIHKMTRDGKKVQIILESRDIITYPRALTLCEHSLFISHYHFTSINNYLSAYKVYPI